MSEEKKNDLVAPVLGGIYETCDGRRARCICDGAMCKDGFNFICLLPSKQKAPDYEIAYRYNKSGINGDGSHSGRIGNALDLVKTISHPAPMAGKTEPTQVSDFMTKEYVEKLDSHGYKCELVIRRVFKRSLMEELLASGKLEEYELAVEEEMMRSGIKCTEDWEADIYKRLGKLVPSSPRDKLMKLRELLDEFVGRVVLNKNNPSGYIDMFWSRCMGVLDDIPDTMIKNDKSKPHNVQDAQEVQGSPDKVEPFTDEDYERMTGISGTQSLQFVKEDEFLRINRKNMGYTEEENDDGNDNSKKGD